MLRFDNREPLELRNLEIIPNAMPFAEGSCQINLGDTRVLCTATVEERVPGWMKGKGSGWLTGEYAMLPRSGRDRNERDRLKPNGRTIEIQRLIGRSLRAVVDLERLGERTIILDCDVIGADGGTRCASITGAYVALCLAANNLGLNKKFITGQISAVSVGLLGGTPLLDLCYEEDSRAQVDMNVVALADGRYVEVQGTAEGMPYDRAMMNNLLDVAQVGLDLLFAEQLKAINA
ncbi:MAG: ribonuclease PH [Armatimonadaceae bacterium]